jgi:hypothetical protein
MGTVGTGDTAGLDVLFPVELADYMKIAFWHFTFMPLQAIPQERNIKGMQLKCRTM